MASRYIVGIDEVGRGPLAGPVVVAAVLIPAGLRVRPNGKRLPLRDSKKLTAIQRDRWRKYLLQHPKVEHALALATPKTIDAVNISRAANAAALRSCARLLAAKGLAWEECDIYLDGGLFLGNGRSRRPGRTVIKGDERIPAVAMASIFAKVFRDEMMVRFGRRYPGYGFEKHKGYGTKAHREALNRLGVTKLHRLTFLQNSAILEAKL